MRIPEDAAVVGFDNWQAFAAAAQPPLSSIDPNLDAIGQEAGRLLIRMIEGERISGTLGLPSSLVERQSSAR